MNYHFLANYNAAHESGLLLLNHEGRTYISEGEILSWLKDLDTAFDGCPSCLLSPKTTASGRGLEEV